MPDWTEADSATYREIAAIAVPRRTEMIATIVDLIPFDRDEAFRAIELGSGEGLLAEAVLARFARARLVAFDGSGSMRAETLNRTSRFADRTTVRAFDLAALDWWDVVW